MITERDRLMVKHIQDFGGLTIKQAELLYFKENNCGYDIARRRLNHLVSIGELKACRDKYLNNKVYYIDKKLSFHGILLMDYFTRITNLGANIKVFKKEMQWLGGDIRSDGFCVFELDGKFYYNLVEVQVSNNDANLERYTKLYDSGLLQQMCGGIFPDIVVIDNVEHKKPFEIPNVRVHQVDFKFSDIGKILS